MRIQGVTGDLPAVAQLKHRGRGQGRAGGRGRAGHALRSPRRRRQRSGTEATAHVRRTTALRRRHFNSFDPPLIAQRAVLGFAAGPDGRRARPRDGETYGEV